MCKCIQKIRECQELREEIEAKLNNKGVTGYSLTVLAAAQIKCQKIVGSCNGDKNNIIYATKSATPIAIPFKPPPAEQTPLFSNFEPGTRPSMPKDGWILGADAQYRVPVTMVGLLVTPRITKSLIRAEIVVGRISGGDKIDGYLMHDNDGPGDLIEKLSFTILRFALIKAVNHMGNEIGLLSSSALLEMTGRYNFK